MRHRLSLRKTENIFIVSRRRMRKEIRGRRIYFLYSRSRNERRNRIFQPRHFCRIGHGGAYDKLEWLESYEGAEGVIKFTYGSQEWPYLTVTPRQSRDYYESAKYVVYRMRFEGGNNPVLINCYGDALSDAEGWKINIDPVEGEGTEYFFDARVLLEFFDNYSENRLVWYATQGTAGTVYIDDVYCVWEAADIEISTQNCKLADVPEMEFCWRHLRKRIPESMNIS